MNGTAKLVVFIALLLGAITLSAIIITQTPYFNTRTIQVDYIGYADLRELANSSKVIVTGTVESIKSTTGTGTEIPTTTFEVKVEGISKLSPEGEMDTVMVQQIGSKVRAFTVEAADDPLMKVGEEFVFFLGGGEDNGWRVPYRTTGPYGRFQVVSGMIYPVSPFWSKYSGMSLDQFLAEVDSILGVKTMYSILWEGKPEIIDNQTVLKPIPTSQYPAPVWLLETWVGKISLHWDELSKRGVTLYMWGSVGDGKILVGMNDVSNETVGIFLDTVRGEVPPGILMFAKGSPIVLT
jgi:hypothetical protein